jgi:hypothetical protein
MTDRTCDGCERLWNAYEQALHCHRIIEHRSAVETGLAVLLRKASNRCEEARKAVLDHETIHERAMVAASSVA